jgi:hypothetical protein
VPSCCVRAIGVLAGGGGTCPGTAHSGGTVFPTATVLNDFFTFLFISILLTSIKGVLMRSCLPWPQEHCSALEQRPGRCPTATHTTPACQQQQQQQRPQQLMHPTPCRQQHHQPQRCQARCSHSSSSSWLHHQAAPAGCISNACPSKLRTKGWGRTISSKIRVPMLQASSWAQSLKAGRTCKLAYALLATYVAVAASCRTCERAKSDCQ